jgi:hypothetical protein
VRRWLSCHVPEPRSTGRASGHRSSRPGTRPRAGPRQSAVNSVLPGAVNTDALRERPHSDALISGEIAQTVLGRIGEPEDPAVRWRMEAIWLCACGSTYSWHDFVSTLNQLGHDLVWCVIGLRTLTASRRPRDTRDVPVLEEFTYLGPEHEKHIARRRAGARRLHSILGLGSAQHETEPMMKWMPTKVGYTRSWPGAKLTLGCDEKRVHHAHPGTGGASCR